MKFASPEILVEFHRGVLDHFAAHRQTGCFSRESGGQLFGTITTTGWIVVRATGPRPTDRRTMWFFRADRSAERKEIQCLFKEGMHYLGDWHTHPQREPQPSGTDLKSMSEMVLKSRHELKGFLMVIVGTNEPPEGLWVSLHRISLPPERLNFVREWTRAAAAGAKR